MNTIPVRSVMSRNVLAVRDDMNLQEVATFLTDNQISGAPVEDGEGRLVGVVSLTDVVRATSEQTSWEPAQFRPRWIGGSDYYLRGLEQRLAAEELEGFQIEESALVVNEIMTPRIFSVDEEATVSDAAKMMREAHIHRLLITSGGRVVGIVTTSDLLGLLVR